MRILVLGYLVRGPLGGLAWHHLQYVLGLSKLGHNVYFLEDSDDYESCYDPIRRIKTKDPGAGLEFADQLFSRFGLEDRWAYYDAHTSIWYGGYAGSIPELCKTADLLLNVSGVNPLREMFLQVPVRVLIDTDPVFTQIRHLTDAAAMRNASAHTAFFSFGENIGTPGCSIPLDGMPWRPTRQPVILEAWPDTPGPAQGNLTTVLHWHSYPAREYLGRSYDMKSASFQPYLELPKKVRPRLELALGGSSAPRDLLREQGWIISDPLEAARDPWFYQQYIQSSRAEFTVAKHGYVISSSGWFSERTAAYLASARPVIIQDTGFGTWLPESRAVLVFRSPEEAVQAIASLQEDYDQRCREARALVAGYFSHATVLNALIEQAFARECSPSAEMRAS